MLETAPAVFKEKYSLLQIEVRQGLFHIIIIICLLFQNTLQKKKQKKTRKKITGTIRIHLKMPFDYSWNFNNVAAWK